VEKTEKNRKISARREFYANLEKIRDLYNNKGFKFAKELYEHLNFNMSLWSFNHYFNKEIKTETPKEKPLIDNNYQINQTKEKDIKDEKQQISTVNDTNERVISDEARQRFERRRALMQPTIEALTLCAKELYKKQQEEEEK